MGIAALADHLLISAFTPSLHSLTTSASPSAPSLVLSSTRSSPSPGGTSSPLSPRSSRPPLPSIISDADGKLALLSRGCCRCAPPSPRSSDAFMSLSRTALQSRGVKDSSEEGIGARGRKAPKIWREAPLPHAALRVDVEREARNLVLVSGPLSGLASYELGVPVVKTPWRRPAGESRVTQGMRGSRARHGTPSEQDPAKRGMPPCHNISLIYYGRGMPPCH